MYTLLIPVGTFFCDPPLVIKEQSAAVMPLGVQESGDRTGYLVVTGRPLSPLSYSLLFDALRPEGYFTFTFLVSHLPHEHSHLCCVQSKSVANILSENFTDYV